MNTPGSNSTRGARTPKESGFTVAPDWTPVERVWMAWPCAKADWGEYLDAAKDAYCAVARTIAAHYPVTMVANPEDVAECSLVCRGVSTLGIPHIGCSMRALGPGFLLNGLGDVAALDWRGDQAHGRGTDDEVAASVIGHLKMPRYGGPLMLEGGAIDVDGEGTALVTEQYFRDYDHKMVEDALAALGLSKVIWLTSGIEGDRTGGHVQSVARFLRPGVVAVATETNEQERNYLPLRANVEHLEGTRDAAGRKISVVELPQPKRRTDPSGGPLPLSYTSMFLSEKLIVVPAFEDKHDQAAYDTLVGAALEKNVVQIPALDIVKGGGGLNTITLPQPEGVMLAKAASC